MDSAGVAPARVVSWLSRLAQGFRPPALPKTSAGAFRFHMAYTLLDAVFAGIIGNAPLMAVKALNATDVQLQVPLSIASVGLAAAVFTGAAMATRRKKPFVLVPGFAGATSALVMAWMNSAGWFLAVSGIISIFDFGMRPAVPSIVRIIYPPRARSHVSGTLRQYSSIAFLLATLTSAWLLSAAGPHVREMIRFEITFAGFASFASYLCFRQLPDVGDGSIAEATAVEAPQQHKWQGLAPFRDRPFRHYMAIFFLYGFSNLFHSGVVPAFLAKDMGLGYVQATMLLHVIPNLSAFATGGWLTAWFERKSVWRSYSLVAFLWGIDPVLLAAAPSFWPAVIAARIARGPATLGSMVLCFFTGVHSFARPGSDTSRYMAAIFLVNAVARLLAPMAAAIMLGFISRRAILIVGGMGILVASALFFRGDALAGKGMRHESETQPVAAN
jgi:MFS family permease